MNVTLPTIYTEENVVIHYHGNLSHVHCEPMRLLVTYF